MMDMEALRVEGDVLQGTIHGNSKGTEEKSVIRSIIPNAGSTRIFGA